MFANIFKFPKWNENAGCYWRCTCTPSQATFFLCPWAANDMQKALALPAGAKYASWAGGGLGESSDMQPVHGLISIYIYLYI